MKILMEADELGGLGGIEVNQVEVANRLTLDGHVVDVLYLEKGRHASAWTGVATTTRRVRSFAIRKSDPADVVRVLPAIWWARRLAPDIIYSNAAKYLPWAVVSGLVARAPVVSHLHAFDRVSATGLLSRRVSHFIAVSQFVSDCWQAAGVPADKISVIHNGVDSQAYPFADQAAREAAREPLGIGARSTVFLFYGRFVPEKGLDLLLKAWKIVRARNPSAELLLVGDYTGSEAADYRALVEDIGLAGARMFGFQSAVQPFIAAADVVVVPSLWQEPFGRAVIEPMSMGRPVVATKVGGIPEVLTGEFTRFLIENPTAEKLAAAMDRAAAAAHSDSGLARRCADHVAQRFSLDETMRRIQTVFDQQVKSKRRRSRYARRRSNRDVPSE